MNHHPSPITHHPSPITHHPSPTSPALGGQSAALDDISPKADDLKDPVCGMSVTSQSPHQAMHDDHHYRFCSTHCRDKFIADPVRYRVSEAPVGT